LGERARKTKHKKKIGSNPHRQKDLEVRAYEGGSDKSILTYPRVAGEGNHFMTAYAGKGKLKKYSYNRQKALKEKKTFRSQGTPKRPGGVERYNRRGSLRVWRAYVSEGSIDNGTRDAIVAVPNSPTKKTGKAGKKACDQL